jgi:alpha-beta hydrolase superfamily lysophospholipase
MIIFDEIGTLLDETRRRYPNHPVFLYGHSLGASTGLQYILQQSGLENGILASASSVF